MLWIFSIFVMANALSDIPNATDGIRRQQSSYVDHCVPIDKKPYHVFIEGLPFTCNGAILSPRYIVTTASCALELRKPYQNVRANSSIWGRNGTEHRIDKVIVHKNHQVLQNGNSINDIALIRVKDLFEIHQSIGLLQNGERVKAGESVTISGVGTVDDQAILLEMQASILGGSDNCTLDSRSGSQFCIKYNGQSRMGATNDDFGDLAVDSAKRLVGIYSSDELGFTWAKPVAVYTNITHYYNWIMGKMNIKPN